MSFIKDITPYIQRIELHIEGKGRFSNREELIKVRDIHFEYIRSKDFKTPTDINCSSCLRHMMTQLKGKIDRDSVKGEKMKFPKVEEKDKFIDYGSDSDYPKELLESIKSDVFYTTDNTTRKELVALCKENGIKTGKVKSQALCDELNNL